MSTLPSACDTLDRVDETIVEAVAGVERVWAGGRLRPEILTEDLPAMLRSRALAGGKRLRPLMCHWGWASTSSDGYGESYQHLVRVGAALELFHLFALVHDDVMDRSDQRRGMPTAHVVASADHRSAGGAGDPSLFGDSVAILLGDLAFAEAAALVAETTAELRRAWREMVVELVQGQLLDLTGAASRAKGVARAQVVARLKSGAYTVQRPLLLGAMAAGAPAGAMDALSQYGRQVGEAFALRDDILGVWGDPAVTGKPVGDDLVAGKATVLIALARERLSPSETDLLDRGADLEPEEVSLLQKSLVTCGVLADVEAMVEDHVVTAREALAAGPIRPDVVEALEALAATIAWRES